MGLEGKWKTLLLAAAPQHCLAPAIRPEEMTSAVWVRAPEPERTEATNAAIRRDERRFMIAAYLETLSRKAHLKEAAL
ncbi:hypothetical protein AAFF_G00389270 [Aldrovandia affinis]|uniref:Uncharacterized protein n=1 Tax=Aldrovandia affinis TaxID=143900 RepID=A0AAD7SE78_9TELE|nr:hypothetical protein AAFF_G00389270 [Aldrovandia affinis]